MIEAIIFDIGGVIIRTADYRFRRQWDEQFRFPLGTIEELVFNSEMGQQAQAGGISDVQLWDWVKGELGLNERELEQLRSDFWAGDKMDEELVQFIRELKKEVQTAVISNATDHLEHLLRIQYPMADAFDLIVGSATEKVMKPDPLIYERTLARLDCLPEAAIFIDDNEQNISSANQLGIHGIQYRRGADIVSQIKETILSAGGLKKRLGG